MKRIIFLIILLLASGFAFSQESKRVPSVIKKVYENDWFYGLGLDLGSLKDRKIEVYSDTVFAKKMKNKSREDWDLVLVDKLTGSGETFEFTNGSQLEEITLVESNSMVAFKTINKNIRFQEWAGGQEEFDLFDKLMASEHHTYILNSTVSSAVTVTPTDGAQDPAMVEMVGWLAKNNHICDFGNRMNNETKVYQYLDKKGNACLLFCSLRTFLANGEPASAGTFFYVENPHDKLLRRVSKAIQLEIIVADNSFKIEKGTDEVIENEEMWNGLIKDAFKDKFNTFHVKKDFLLETTVVKER